MSLLLLRRLATTSKSLRQFSTIPPSTRRTTTEFDNLIYEAGNSNDFESVRRLLNTRVTHACFNTTSTFKFLTNTATYTSSLEHLRRILPQTEPGYTRKHAYETLIARVCKLNRTEDGLVLINDMFKGKFGISACTFHPIINTLTKKNKIEEAWGVVGRMRLCSVFVDVTVYNYFLMSFCYDGDVVETVKVLRLMEEEGLSADTRTYDALVLGACKSGNVEAAMTVLRRVEEVGLPVLYSTHAHVIAAMVECGYYELVVEFVMAYVGKDNRLDEENLGSLASKFIKRKRFKEAVLVLKEMCVRGLRMGNGLRDFYENNVVKTLIDT